MVIHGHPWQSTVNHGHAMAAHGNAMIARGNPRVYPLVTHATVEVHRLFSEAPCLRSSFTFGTSAKISLLGGKQKCYPMNNPMVSVYNKNVFFFSNDENVFFIKDNSMVSG